MFLCFFCIFFVNTSCFSYMSFLSFWKKTDSALLEYDSEEWDEELWNLAIDVLENAESIYVLAPIAGITLEEIDISVHETTLSIRGTRKKPKEFYEYEMELRNEECFWWGFLRKVMLPENMDFSAIKAVMENNLLVIHIPKIRTESSKIQIEKIDI